MLPNHKQSRFVFEYTKDYNATKAYIRAGYSENGASASASALLAQPSIQAALKEREEMLAEVATLDCAWVLRQWMAIASADPNELVSVKQLACGDCYDDDTRQLLESNGLGATLSNPNPACKVCKGHGEKFVSVADTSKLRGSARRLYAGAVQTKDGIKVLMRDQDAAVGNLARYLGMLVDKRELSGPGGGPVQLEAVTADDLTDEQLMAIASSSPLLLEGER